MLLSQSQISKASVWPVHSALQCTLCTLLLIIDHIYTCDEQFVNAHISFTRLAHSLKNSWYLIPTYIIRTEIHRIQKTGRRQTHSSIECVNVILSIFFLGGDFVLCQMSCHCQREHIPQTTYFIVFLLLLWSFFAWRIYYPDRTKHCAAKRIQ